MNYDLSVIIVNYLNYWDTLRLLEDLTDQKEISFKYYIIDNHSPNESVEKLRESIPSRSILILNNENVGYARAINQGLKMALAEGIEYSLVVNNDITIHNEFFFRNMVDTIHSHSKYGTIGPLIYDQSNRLNKVYFKQPSLIDIFFGEMLSRARFNKLINLFENSNGLIPVYRISGSCFLLNNKIVRKVGFLDENTFLYGEEENLTERFRLNGYLTGLLCNEKVIHYHSSSVNISIPQFKKAMLQAKNKNYHLQHYRGCSRIISKIISTSFFIVTLTRFIIINFKNMLNQNIKSNV